MFTSLVKLSSISQEIPTIGKATDRDQGADSELTATRLWWRATGEKNKNLSKYSQVEHHPCGFSSRLENGDHIPNCFKAAYI